MLHYCPPSAGVSAGAADDDGSACCFFLAVLVCREADSAAILFLYASFLDASKEDFKLFT
jgi:hypothetical protein